MSMIADQRGNRGLEQHCASSQVHPDMALPSTPRPASTVLTDERIAQIWHTGSGTDYNAFARAIEREVAAQAGQVAVPEVLAKVTTICAELRDFYAESKRHELSAVVCALMDRIGDEFSSPAKESK